MSKEYDETMKQGARVQQVLRILLEFPKASQEMQIELAVALLKVADIAKKHEPENTHSIFMSVAVDGQHDNVVSIKKS